MIATYELNIIEQPEIWDNGDGTTSTEITREPDFNGAQIRRWGQITNNGSTMLLWLEADEEELAKLPEEARR